MKQFSRIREIQEYLQQEVKLGKEIGFVPTMGALHEGHLSLISRSREENDITVCSIFVNPIQFNNKTDLEKYPRDLQSDLVLLENAGCDVVFNPEEKEMYPGDSSEAFDFHFDPLENILEGKYRPGHFKGVAIVVKKLFDIVAAHRAYFGKKDYQQLMVIRKMVEQFQIPVTIISCPIIREPDGLAMSSRNVRLSKTERQIAPVIFKVLSTSKGMAGKMPVKEFLESGTRKLEENPEIKVEYFELANSETLQPVISWDQNERPVLLTAIYLGDIRLIDNLELFS